MLGTPLNKLIQEAEENDLVSPTQSQRVPTNILKRVVENRVSRSNTTKIFIKFGSNECTKMAQLCALYQISLGTLTQLKLDILTGAKSSFQKF